ncbi:hypothetical protein BD770DRAFT_434037 [Pilaira anomala]|nr:hypothetical protein BD770DRAFT_434037 [Pilaira anomala]
MGVQGLWSLLRPASRRTELESLTEKRIAVDASIWAHQFMRTMRDQKGEPLRNGHLLGFFRRICKLLFINVKPVFVFDGGTPSIKRNVIRERRKLREGFQMHLGLTARKILKSQIKSLAIFKAQKRSREEEKSVLNEEFGLNDDSVTSREFSNKSRKIDPYELPQIETPVNTKIDPRLATTEEIQDFVTEFTPTEDNLDSEVFNALPPSIQYEVIQDLKVKSRQASGSRLSDMVGESSTAMDFSKNQIKSLQHRNVMTQRLMQMNTAAAGTTEAEPSRIAGERGKQYVLYKNEDLNQGLGWKLPGLSATQPVELDNDHPEPKLEVPDQKNLDSLPAAKDNVQAAIEANPRLAALANSILSMNEDENVEVMEDDEEEYYESAEEYQSENDEYNTDKEGDLEVYTQTRYISEEEDNGSGEDELGIEYNNNKENDLEVYTQTRHISEEQEEDDDDDEEAYSDCNLLSDSFENPEYQTMDHVPLYLGESPLIESSASQMYQSAPEPLEGTEDSFDELKLDLEDLFNLWLSRMPQSFSDYNTGTNHHIEWVRSVFQEEDMDVLKVKVRSARKLYGKTNELDYEKLEAYRYCIDLLRTVIEWNYQNYENEEEETESEQVKTEIAAVLDEQAQREQSVSSDHEKLSESNNSTPIVLYDEDDEEELKFTNGDQDIEDGGSFYIKQEEDLDAAYGALNSEHGDLSHLQENQQSVQIDMSNSLLKSVNDNSSQTLMNPNLNANTTTGTTIEVSKNIKPNSAIQPSNDENQDSEHIDDQMNIDIGYNSEDELYENAENENAEYAQFLSDIGSKGVEEVRSELKEDMEKLNEVQRKNKGNSDEITDQMIRDIQEMLKLFGIPFIVSPMEAEAQCAELEQLSLIDGTITDDSDAFLFGASRVYKNMFNQQRSVECYQIQDIEREMFLERKRLVQLAFLLGSDYTEGIAGVGPVTAMEILHEFSSDGDEAIELPLQKFKDWYYSNKDETPFQKKFRKKHSALEIPEDFPSRLVIDAYYNPLVDKSSQKFEWGQPQLDKLRLFLEEAFGWSEEKSDQVLLPVLQKMNSKKRTRDQQEIDTYFSSAGTISTNENPHTHSSKRVRSIVESWRTQKRHKSNHKN